MADERRTEEEAKVAATQAKEEDGGSAARECAIQWWIAVLDVLLGSAREVLWVGRSRFPTGGCERNSTEEAE
jgi:hypothetical protein